MDNNIRTTYDQFYKYSMRNFMKTIPFWGLLLWSSASFADSFQAVLPEADSVPPKDWINLDPQDNGIVGTGSDKTYELLLKDKSPKKTVVVAVIDQGDDIDTQDLHGR